MIMVITKAWTYWPAGEKSSKWFYLSSIPITMIDRGHHQSLNYLVVIYKTSAQNNNNNNNPLCFKVFRCAFSSSPIWGQIAQLPRWVGCIKCVVFPCKIYCWESIISQGHTFALCGSCTIGQLHNCLMLAIVHASLLHCVAYFAIGQLEAKVGKKGLQWNKSFHLCQQCYLLKLSG